MVTLLVGESEKPFYVHLDLLCDASEFFRAAFKGNFQESSEKTMRLPEDDESIFELFVDWLYYQRYDDHDRGKGWADKSDQEVRFFVFADKYQVSKLKRLIIGKIFAGASGRGPALSLVSWAYEHTTRDSGLRKLLADWHAWMGDRKWFERPAVQEFLRRQPDFSADINLSFLKKIEKGPKHQVFSGDMPEEYYDEEPELKE